MFFEDINVVYVEQVIKKKNNDPACKVPSSLQSSGGPRNSALHLRVNYRRTKGPKTLGAVMNAVDLCAVAILAIVCVAEVVSAEEFDFDGSAFIHCVCPSPSQAGDCTRAGREEWGYDPAFTG